jgi:uncharacterized protein (TIGR04255 family)
MISEQELLEIFPHPSVREVALELRFAPRLKIASEVWRIQDCLAESYPTVSEEMQPKDGGGLLQAYVFANSEKGRSIKVSQESFMVLFNQYGSFEEFKDESLRQVDAFTDKFGIETFRRAGLRYVNHIELAPEHGIEDLARYVNLPVDFERFNPASIEQFSTEIRLAVEEHQMTIRDELLRVPGKDGRLFMLDLECHAAAHIRMEELPLLMDQFHRKIQIQFLEHVREAYKRIMRGESEDGFAKAASMQEARVAASGQVRS